MGKISDVQNLKTGTFVQNFQLDNMSNVFSSNYVQSYNTVTLAHYIVFLF
jgi:hypothetical protein